MMMSARYESRHTRADVWIEIKGIGTGIQGISIGQAYALRDALNATLEEWEKEDKEMREDYAELKKK